MINQPLFSLEKQQFQVNYFVIMLKTTYREKPLFAFLLKAIFPWKRLYIAKSSSLTDVIRCFLNYHQWLHNDQLFTSLIFNCATNTEIAITGESQKIIQTLILCSSSYKTWFSICLCNMLLHTTSSLVVYMLDKTYNNQVIYWYLHYWLQKLLLSSYHPLSTTLGSHPDKSL